MTPQEGKVVKNVRSKQFFMFATNTIVILEKKNKSEPGFLVITI